MKVELRDIRKYFGPVRANDGISVTFEEGTIYGLLGENGAGKSTLMKVLSGYLIPDGGQILLDGERVHFSVPAEATARGIGMLHQTPMDFPPFSVLDNFIYGQPGGLLPDRKAAREQFLKLCRRFNFDLSPDAFIDGLTIGERQQMEIVRLLSLGVRVLILDEPTTGISAEQKEILFRTLRELAHNEGLTIIFVSHKLEDVEELCDEVVVLRRGKLVGREKMPVLADKLVEMMFGQVLERTPRPPVELGTPVLQVENLSASTFRLTLEPVTLDVREGEVIGLAGLEGSGQALFMRACCGLIRPRGGKVILDGRDMTGKGYHEFMAAGVAYAPAGRLEEGLIAGLTLTEHFVLAAPSHDFLVDWEGARKVAQSRIERFNIVGRPESPVETLSGGNQQRVLMALMPERLRLLLLEHPTRGLDVESARWIWKQLLERRSEGTAVIFMSSDLDEIVEYSDRILVFYAGRAIEVPEPASATVEQLGHLIGGKGI